MSLRVIVAVCAAVLVLAAIGAAGKPVPPSYTAAQADRGRLAYIENCAECHGGQQNGKYGPALNGPDARMQWETVRTVYTFTTAQMPNGNAGGLPKETYLDIMAYLLRLHGNAPGTKPLTDADATNSLAVIGEAK
ncbi:MAG TPA: c-type cytochrome [Candidatus Baltobacteraceae bacterium]|jgi:quinoprotein glucose dehydrogenase